MFILYYMMPFIFWIFQETSQNIYIYKMEKRYITGLAFVLLNK